MRKITLIRIAAGEFGTLGCLIYSGRPFAVTLELPWYESALHKSCLPAQLYGCERVSRSDLGEVFAIMNPPNHSEVLIHWGTRPRCGGVAVGEEFATIEGRPTVLTLANAPGRGFNELLRIVRDSRTFLLDIMWTQGVLEFPLEDERFHAVDQDL